jgi:hypothetical protein
MQQHQQYMKIFMNGQLDEIRVAFKMLSKNLPNVLKLEIKIKEFFYLELYSKKLFIESLLTRNILRVNRNLKTSSDEKWN